MAIRILCALCLAMPALFSGASPAGANPGGVARLIPGLSPVVLVVNNPGRFAENLQGYFPAGGQKAAPAAGEPAGAATLFRLLGFGEVPQGIDLNGELAAAMPQFPFPLFLVPVSDYDLFLSGLRGGVDPATGTPPPAQVAGLDPVTIAGKPLFSKREGNHALVSPLPMLLTPPAEGESLAGRLAVEESSLLGDSDFFLRFDVGLTLALIEPFIAQYRAGMKEALAKAPSSGPDRAEVQRLLEAEVDLLLQGIRQVHSLSTGGKARTEGFNLSTLYLPRPASGFARLLSLLTHHRHDLLDFFDGDAAMAGAIRFDPGTLGELAEAITGFMFTSGIYDLSESDREAWRKLMREGMALAGSESAYYLGPPKSGGAFSTLFISEVKETERARALMRESVSLTERLVASAPGQPEMHIELETGVHEHGGVPIDRFRFIVSHPEGGEEAVKYREAMEAFFGGEDLEIWVAFLDGYMVASYYTPSPGELKEMIDRLRSREGGGLPSSAAFRRATASLPRENSSLFFFSFPRFVALILDMAGKLRPGEALPPWPLADEDSSGIGTSMYRSGGALKVDTFIPWEEASNIRAVTEYLRALGPLPKKTVPAGTERPVTPL